MKVVPYKKGMGRAPVLEIYLNRSKRWNWRLTGRNGEPLCRGVGERGSAFGSPRAAWSNCRLSTSLMSGAQELRLPARLPRKGDDLAVMVSGPATSIDPSRWRDRMVLRIKRTG
jgi:hypothetical protein